MHVHVNMKYHLYKHYRWKERRRNEHITTHVVGLVAQLKGDVTKGQEGQGCTCLVGCMASLSGEGDKEQALMSCTELHEQ